MKSHQRHTHGRPSSSVSLDKPTPQPSLSQPTNTSLANITVEIPYQILLGIVVYAAYYYPIYTRGGIQSSERQGLILLFCIQLFVFASTYSNMIIAALPDAETAGAIATLMFSLILTFNGVFQPPEALPGFWIFMYRVSPLTYLGKVPVLLTSLHKLESRD